MQLQPYGVWLAAASLIGILLFAVQSGKQGFKKETRTLQTF